MTSISTQILENVHFKREIKEKGWKEFGGRQRVSTRIICECSHSGRTTLMIKSCSNESRIRAVYPLGQIEAKEKLSEEAIGSLCASLIEMKDPFVGRWYKGIVVEKRYTERYSYPSNSQRQVPFKSAPNWTCSNVHQEISVKVVQSLKNKSFFRHWRKHTPPHCS